MYKRMLVLVLLLELCLVTVINLLSGDSPLFEFEEVARTRVAETFVHRGFYYWSRHPFLPCEIIIRGCLVYFGFSISLLRYVSSFFFIVSLIFLEKLTFLFTQQHKKIFLLAALNPLLLLYGATASLESFFLILFFATLYLFLKEEYFLAADVYFLCCLTSFSAFLLMIPAFLSILLYPKTKKAFGPLLLIISGFSAFSLLSYISQIYAGNPLYFIWKTQATSRYLLLFRNFFGLNSFTFILPLLVYPLLMVGPFFFIAQQQTIKKLIQKRISYKDFFVVTTIAVAVLANTYGVISMSILPWARYYLPIIPLFLFVSANGKLNKKMVCFYFVSAGLLTALQIYWGRQFINCLS